MKFKVGDIVVTKSRYPDKPEIHDIDLVGRIIEITSPHNIVIKIDETKTPYEVDTVWRAEKDIKIEHEVIHKKLLKKAKEMRKLLGI